jgi:hypothetical protein
MDTHQPWDRTQCTIEVFRERWVDISVPHMVRTVVEFVSRKMIYCSQRGQVRGKGNAIQFLNRLYEAY